MKRLLSAAGAVAAAMVMVGALVAPAKAAPVLVGVSVDGCLITFTNNDTDPVLMINGVGGQDGNALGLPEYDLDPGESVTIDYSPVGRDNVEAWWTVIYYSQPPGEGTISGSTTVCVPADSTTGSGTTPSTGTGSASGTDSTTGSASAGTDRAYVAPRTGAVADEATSVVPAALAGAALLAAGVAGRIALARRD